MTDQELVAAYQGGQTEAFGELYERYSAKIYRFIYYRVSRKEVAEDLLSAVFTKALFNLGRFKTGGTFQAWLYTIARNAVIDHFRTNKEAAGLEEADQLVSAGDLEGLTDDKRKLEEVRRYLDDLKPQQREVVVLRVWEGLSYREIADIVGGSEAACKMSFCRTINELRRRLPLSALILFFLA